VFKFLDGLAVRLELVRVGESLVKVLPLVDIEKRVLIVVGHRHRLSVSFLSSELC